MSWFRPKSPPPTPVPGRHASHGRDEVGMLSPTCDACRPLLVENITRAADVGWSREFMRTVLADVDGESAALRVLRQDLIHAALHFHWSEIEGNVTPVPRPDVRAELDRAVEAYRHAAGMSGVAAGVTVRG